jgi:hypothetical protein
MTLETDDNKLKRRRGPTTTISAAAIMNIQSHNTLGHSNGLSNI